MKERCARFDKSGRITVPASLRKTLGIQPGDMAVFRIENDELQVTTLWRRLCKAQGLVCKHVASTASLADELIAERREAARRESNRDLL